MVDKKGLKAVNRNEIILIILVLGFMAFVFATPGITFFASVVDGGNYTGNTLSINLTTNFNASNVSQATVDLNATCFYNSSGGDIEVKYGDTFLGGDTGAFGSMFYNTSEITADLNTTFSSSVDISLLTLDSFTYNISCLINNGSDQNWTSVTNVTIDRTPPEVNFSSSSDVSAYGNYSASDIYGPLNINVSVADALDRLKWLNVKFQNLTFVYINITNGTTGEQVNFTRALNLSRTTTFFNMTINLSNSAAYPDGKYNITVYTYDGMNDTLLGANNVNNSENIQITLDRVVPTSVTLTRGTGSTKTQNVITITAVDATSGIDNCIVRTGGSTGFIDSSTTITGRGTGTQTLTHTGLSCGTSYSYFVKCFDQVDHQLESDSTSFSTSSCGGGTDDGGPSTVSSTVETNVLDISPDVEATLSGFEEDMGIQEIKISVTEVADNVQIVVTKFDTEPIEITVSKTGNVHKYLQITSQNLGTKLERAILTIKVQKNWLLDNSVDKANMALFKFNEAAGVWDELLTVYIEEDATYYYYDVEVDSFSYFAIAEKVIEGELPEPEPERNLLWLWIVIGIVVVAVIVGGGVAVKKKK